MAKYSVVFGESGVSMKPVDGKGKDFESTFEDAMSMDSAMSVIRTDMGQRGDVTRAVLTILVQVLQSPRLDAYRGKIALDSGLSKDFKESMRVAEFEILEPIFNARYDALNVEFAKPDNEKHTEYKISRGQQFTAYLSGLRETGMYPRAKATSCLYLGYFGKLPCAYNADNTPDTGKLLGVTAMEKIIANAKTDLAKAENDGFSKRLTDLLADMKAKTQKSHVGNVATALVTLKELTTMFEALQKEESDKALAAHQAKQDTQKAQEATKATKEADAKAAKNRGHSVKKDADALIAQAAKAKADATPAGTVAQAAPF